MIDEPPGPSIDTTVPQSARIWNYWLGGTDNYPVDRAAGDAWLATDPTIAARARAGRQFLGRAITYLAAEAGIRQFLDVGSGLPTASNTHEIAQRVAPDARIVYLDRDPMIVAHAQRLLTSTPEGATRFLDVDMHDTAAVHTGAGEILDPTRPVAVLFMGVLGHVSDLAEARAVVRRTLAPFPSGSYLVLADGTLPTDPEARRRAVRAQQDYADTGAMPYWSRTVEEVAGFFEGLELVDPGLVSVSRWRPDDAGPPEPLGTYGGVARKP